MSVKFIWSIVLFNAEVYLVFCLFVLFYIFDLGDLSVCEVLKLPTIIVLGSVYAFVSSSVCFMKLGC
jgi:hypothetical protein